MHFLVHAFNETHYVELIVKATEVEQAQQLARLRTADSLDTFPADVGAIPKEIIKTPIEEHMSIPVPGHNYRKIRA